MNLTSIKLTVTGAQAWATVTGPLTSGMVGLPVTIEYDEAWDGLTKNLVCRCSPWNCDTGEIRTILNVGENAVVAHEVMQAGQYLHLGVEGFREDGTLVIPTTWARCAQIQFGANADGDPSADPELPIWDQLQAQIGQLDRDGIPQETLDEVLRCADAAVQAASEATRSEQNAAAFALQAKTAADSMANMELTVEVISLGGDTGGSVAVTGLSLDLTSYNAKTGGGFYINPIVAPANATNRSVIWQSSKPAVATVNNMGYVECIAEGEAVITCTTVDGGFTATCAVSVAAAESGGGDSGDGNGGETTGQKIQFSTLERTAGGIKADGTAHTLPNTHNAEVPYTEGMYIRTIWKNGWAAATYPAILVVSGGVYSKPDYSYMTNDDGSLKIDGVATTALGNIAEATLTGFAAGSTVIINMLYPDGSSDSELDATDLLYYIPGGES